MRRTSILLAALLLLGSHAVAGEGVQWVKSLAEARKQAKERGAMIFIAMFMAGEVANVAQQEVFRDPKFVKASKDFVCLFACPEPMPTKLVKLDGKQVERCEFAPMLTNEEHMQAYNEVLADYANLNTDSTGATRMPFNFVIDAAGKVLDQIANGTKEGGFDAVDLTTMLSHLQALVQKYGRGITAEEYAELTKLLAAAEEECAKQRYDKALKAVGKILAKNDKTAFADRARKIRDEIESEGRAEIEKALALVEDKPLDAVMEFERLRKTFAGTSVGKAAKAELAKLQKRPDVKKALESLAARRKAQRLLEDAEGLIGKKQFWKGLKALDAIAKKYEGTPEGDRARGRAAKLRADPEIAKQAREQEAARYGKSLLSMGRSYAANGMIDRARRKFQEIIDRFPGTTYAELAKKELEKLK